MPRVRHPITAGSLVAVTSGRWVPPRWPCHVTGSRRHDPYGSSHDESAHHEHAVGTTGRHHASAAEPRRRLTWQTSLHGASMGPPATGVSSTSSTSSAVSTAGVTPSVRPGTRSSAIDIDRRFSADAYLDIGDVAAVLDGPALATGRHLRLTALQQLQHRVDGQDVAARLASGSQAQRAPSRRPPHRHRGHAPGPRHPAHHRGAPADLLGHREPAGPAAQPRPAGRYPAADGLVLPARARPRQADGPLGCLPARARPAGWRATTETPTTSLHPVAVGRAHRVASAPRRRGASRGSWRSGSGSHWSSPSRKGEP